MFDTKIATDLVATARDLRSTADHAEADLLVVACQWADAHPATDCAATYLCRGQDTELLIAGDGCPTISEFAVPEFALAVGMSTEAAKYLIGQALELRHRLPRIWRRVQAGEVQAWRARKVAEKTIPLSREAAAHVDRQIAGFVHKSGSVQLDRLVDDAVGRFMPEVVEQQRLKALDRRHVTIEASRVSFDGTCWMEGELDLGDALDLEQALQAGAEALKAGGSEESLDARRAMTLGDLARGDQPLDLEASERAPRVEKRQVVLHVHMSDAATTGTLEECSRLPVTVDTIRDWCGGAAKIVIKPVIDLNQEISTDAYEVTDRIREHIVLRDRTCVFPFCNRPARRADADHINGYDDDGPPGQTATTKLACLCRSHHRLKTHGGWTYRVITPGVYEWRSPLGFLYRR